MRESDKYHKWIEWDEEDRVYIGKCPDLITGIHGDNPEQLYNELCEVVEDVVRYFKDNNRVLPRPQAKPPRRADRRVQAIEKANIGNFADGAKTRVAYG